MTPRALARQYAGALFDVALKQGRLAAIRQDVSGFATLVSSHAELGDALKNPAVPVARKRALVGALLEASGGVIEEVQRLLLLLADHDRLMYLDDVVAAFVERAMEAERVIDAEVTTARGLDDGARAKLGAALSQATGRQVTVRERVDAGIIGGVVARVGGVVFDGSAARHLERLRERLLAER